MSLVFRTIFLVCILLVSMPAEAATLYIDPSESDLFLGDTISLAVRIDTADGECVNAVDGVIAYTDNILPVDVSLGNSIFPVWIETPTINTENNIVTFAGGIPNGYCGRIEGDPRLTNVIAEILLQTPSNVLSSEDTKTEAVISFTEQTKVYLNDGAGTEALLQTIDGSVNVYAETPSEVTDAWKERIQNDTFSPNAFSISLESDPSIYGGKYFIVFNTTDKQSGIDHYEVIEESFGDGLFDWGRADAPWIVARSPYVLTDQKLNSIIRVKAIDKAGNEYIAVYEPDESVRDTSGALYAYIVMGLFGILFVGVGIGAVLVYRRRGTPTSHATYEDNGNTHSDHD